MWGAESWKLGPASVEVPRNYLRCKQRSERFLRRTGQRQDPRPYTDYLSVVHHRIRGEWGARSLLEAAAVPVLPQPIFLLETMEYLTRKNQAGLHTYLHHLTRNTGWVMS